jgi:hypothetical protein
MQLISSEDFHGSPVYIGKLLDNERLAEALSYWDSLPKTNGLPHRRDFDPLAIPRLLPEVYLVDALADDRFVYRLAGTRLEQLYQRPFKGRTPQEIFPESADGVMGAYRLVRDTRQVFYRRGVMKRIEPRRETISYSLVVMPFSRDGTTVSQLFGVHSHLSEDR